MAGLFVFSIANEASFVSAITSEFSASDETFGLSDSDEYFIYMVDADSSESRTGAYEIVSYGYKSVVHLPYHPDTSNGSN